MLQHLQPGLSCWQEVRGEGEQRFSMTSSGTADALCCAGCVDARDSFRHITAGVHGACPACVFGHRGRKGLT